MKLTNVVNKTIFSACMKSGKLCQIEGLIPLNPKPNLFPNLNTYMTWGGEKNTKCQILSSIRSGLLIER